MLFEDVPDWEQLRYETITLLHVSGDVCACCLKMYQTLGTITL